MLRALELLQANPSIEFRSAVARAAGTLEHESQATPNKTYTVTEISELFNYLFDLMQGRTEKEPAGGNRTGSDT